MKCLSVQEPWASMIASGEKDEEYRSRATSYRGELLIAVSKKPRSEIGGLAICLVDLVDVRKCKRDEFDDLADDDEPPYVWVLRNPRKIVTFPVKGQLGIYNVPEERGDIRLLHGPR